MRARQWLALSHLPPYKILVCDSLTSLQQFYLSLRLCLTHFSCTTSYRDAWYEPSRNIRLDKTSSKEDSEISLSDWLTDFHSVKMDAVVQIIQHHLEKPNAPVLTAGTYDPSSPNSTVELIVDENVPEFSYPSGSIQDKIVIFSAFPKNFGHIKSVCSAFINASVLLILYRFLTCLKSSVLSSMG